MLALGGNAPCIDVQGGLRRNEVRRSMEGMSAPGGEMSRAN